MPYKDVGPGCDKKSFLKVREDLLGRGKMRGEGSIPKKMTQDKKVQR